MPRKGLERDLLISVSTSTPVAARNIIIAKKLTKLRKENNLTHLQLAEKLNYSDKAISKWERAESIPDVLVLKSIADLFGVTVDYLLCRQEKRFLDISNFLLYRFINLWS